MKRITFLFLLLTYFISANGGTRICKTNWPHMGHNCIIVNNNRVSVELILESKYNNSSTFSDFKVVINSRSIPISFFKISSTPSNNGYYQYRYTHSESHTSGDDEFEYNIDYLNKPSNVFKVYSNQSIALTKDICNPNNEYANYLKLSDSGNLPIANIHPNPFNSELTIEHNVENEKVMWFDIIDLNGKIILSKNTQIGIPIQKIDTSELAPGIYYCRIYNYLNSSYQKLIKTK